MNSFKSTRGNSRQAIDGILSAPSRPHLNGRTVGRRSLAGANVRGNGRAIGDFSRSEGYHPANDASSTAAGTSAPALPSELPTKQPLSLHKTLPKAGRFGRRRNSKGDAKTSKRWDKARIKKWSIRGSLIVLALLLLLGGFLFVKGYMKLHKVFKGGGSSAALSGNVNPSLLKGEGDGRVNILLLGRGGDGHDGADLTDTILIASIDPVNKKAALVSIPRDLWVKSPSGGHSKINAVFANAKYAAQYKGADKAKAEKAGIDALEGTIKDVLGVDTHYYTLIDFQAFKQAVDTVGGVDITVPKELAVTERLWDTTIGKSYYLNVPAGVQHFDGQRALFFTRSRHTSARGDFDRAERQRLFIAALSQKILSAGTYTNPVKISQLMDAFGNHIATDFSVNDAVRLANLGKGINVAQIESIGLSDPPNDFLTTGMISGQSVVIPKAGAGEYEAIQVFIRSKLRDGYIAKENAQIHVLNGTATPGLATQKADQLKTYGYTIGTVGDAPTQTYTKTTIVDLSGGKKPYTKNYLEKRFGVKVVTKLPDATIQPGTASFVIILGQNETIN